jgi:hypothetical protein
MKTRRANGSDKGRYKVEILTATNEGFAAFLLDLKRLRLRHQLPADAWAKLKKGPKYRKQSYSEAIDALVRKWEDQVRAEIQAEYDERKARAAAATKAAAAASHLGVLVLSSPREDLALAEGHKKEGEARLHRIKDYIGPLNRDINEPRVEAYAVTMSAGEWFFTPDPIVVTDEGAIINGQHRLLAAEGVLTGEQGRYQSFAGIRSFSEFTLWPATKVPQFVVVWGVDKRAAILMDEARRSSNDRRDIALRYANASK